MVSGLPYTTTMVLHRFKLFSVHEEEAHQRCEGQLVVLHGSPPSPAAPGLLSTSMNQTMVAQNGTASPQLGSPCKELINNNNNVEAPSMQERELLAKMEEANRLIEADVKSAVPGNSGHSRRSSDTSQVSVNSGASSQDKGEDCEENVWDVWGRIVNDWDTYWKKKNQYVKDLVHKGIPLHFRGIAWQLLCGANESPLKNQYMAYLKEPSPCEKVIRRDIARTYPEHDFFKEKDGLGQESLFNVMKAYSLHDREVGYCQGSAFIVGLLLMQMPEEEAFVVLVKLMQEYRLREMFKPTMAELGLCMFQLEALVQEHLPNLHVHFQSQGFQTSMFASSWFLTLYTTSLPLNVAYRIMDVFLCEGMEIIFRVAYGILLISKDDILSLDMEGMLKYFQKEMPSKVEADPEYLFSLASSLKYNSKRMKKLEKEYQAVKSKEQEDAAELRRLRVENRQLKKRNEELELESSKLADRLLQGQVSRAEEEESNFVIRRELAAIRQHDVETNKKLQEAQDRIQRLSAQIEEQQTSRQSSMEEASLKTELLEQKEELIRCYHDQLLNVRLREAENEGMIRDLKARIQELEDDNKVLRESTPDHTVAHLQEELIAAKLCVAEGSKDLGDLRQQVADLQDMWERHLQEYHTEQTSPQSETVLSAPKKLLFGDSSKISKLQEEVYSLRLRETKAQAEVKELRHKVMELEAQVSVTTNQLRRQDEENKTLREDMDHAETHERELQVRLRDQQHKYTDLQSQMKEELMKARIRDVENTHFMAELTQKISNLELKNKEMETEGELHSVEDSDRVKELQDKVADLKAEVLRLQAINRKLNHSVSMQNLGSPLRGSPEDDMDFGEDLRLKLDLSPRNSHDGTPNGELSS